MAHADFFGPDIVRHEAAHSDQWATFSDEKTFWVAYTKESVKSELDHYGDPAIGNSFEIGANLYWGGYEQYLTPSEVHAQVQYNAPGV
jgi:hypothetical protein